LVASETRLEMARTTRNGLVGVGPILE